MILNGVGASAGIGIGTVVKLEVPNLDYSGVKFAGVAAETARLQKAVKAFEQKTTLLAEAARKNAGAKEAEILTGQITMLNDPFMLSQMEKLASAGQPAEAALAEVCDGYATMFEGADDDLLRQRATDVRDIKTRMLKLLMGIEEADASAVPHGTILVAADLPPSVTAAINPHNVVGIATEMGGKTSHSAIMARALGIPAVLGIKEITAKVNNGDAVVLDGETGEVVLTPDGDTLAAYSEKRKQWQEKNNVLAAFKALPTVNASGNHYSLYANIGSVAEAVVAAENGAEGIGLFRTEFLYMGRQTPPTEAEQLEVYTKVAEVMQGKEVIIRTLDVGGDKEVPALGLQKEENPFLGYRAIRYCLENPEIFGAQLRALLRAGVGHKNIKIMLPLITGVEQVRAAKKMLQSCKAQLAAQGLPFDDSMPLGIMVETPAAAMLADVLASEVDFFSIGTNDLTQYILAVDRGNSKVERLYTTYHPAVLRSVQTIIAAAKATGIPVGMCGEAAADKALLPLWMAFGLDEFSVGGGAVLATRKAISGWHTAHAAKVAAQAMRLSSSEEVEQYLKSVVPL